MDISIVPAADKFDVLSSTYDRTPTEYLATWDGDTLENMMGDLSGRRILEIGCGTGRLLLRLQQAGADVTGIDVSDEMVQRAIARGVRAIHSDVMTFTPDSTYDLIVSVLTFHYIKDKSSALARVHDMLNPGGEVLLSLDCQERDVAIPWGNKALAAPYFPESKESYRNSLVESGLEVLDLCDLQRKDESEVIGFIIKASRL